jgi:hypothetical protein
MHNAQAGAMRSVYHVLGQIRMPGIVPKHEIQKPEFKNIGAMSFRFHFSSILP